MLTIKTTGDDAWDTDAKLITALTGYDVAVNGTHVEIRGANDDGMIIVRPLDINHFPGGPVFLMDAHNIEIEVL